MRFHGVDEFEKTNHLTRHLKRSKNLIQIKSGNKSFVLIIALFCAIKNLKKK